MRVGTFREFVYGTIQGIILIGVTYGAWIVSQKKVIKDMFKED